MARPVTSDIRVLTVVSRVYYAIASAYLVASIIVVGLALLSFRHCPVGSAQCDLNVNSLWDGMYHVLFGDEYHLVDYLHPLAAAGTLAAAATFPYAGWYFLVNRHSWKTVAPGVSRFRVFGTAFCLLLSCVLLAIAMWTHLSSPNIKLFGATLPKIYGVILAAFILAEALGAVLQGPSRYSLPAVAAEILGRDLCDGRDYSRSTCETRWLHITLWNLFQGALVSQTMVVYGAGNCFTPKSTIVIVFIMAIQFAALVTAPSCLLAVLHHRLMDVIRVLKLETVAQEHGTTLMVREKEPVYSQEELQTLNDELMRNLQAAGFL